MATRVLVVDDDPDILEIVATALSADGFIVVTAASRDEAENVLATHRPDVALLDVMMETHDAGHQLCRHIKGELGIPVIFLTARATDIDAVIGLELGADDYVKKPFSPRELIARVRAVLRRPDEAPAATTTQRWDIGQLIIDRERLEVSGPLGLCTLSRTEFLILQKLSSDVGVVFRRPEIVAYVYGSEDGASERTIDSHIRHLRSKLVEVGDDPIETVRGVGYRVT